MKLLVFTPETNKHNDQFQEVFEVNVNLNSYISEHLGVICGAEYQSPASQDYKADKVIKCETLKVYTGVTALIAHLIEID